MEVSPVRSATMVIILVIVLSSTSSYKVVSDNHSEIIKEGNIRNNDSVHHLQKRDTQPTRTGRLLGGSHRLQMLFPLLLNIASRLAQVVMMALASMASTFVMAALAKKAFIISLVAFGIMVYDMYHKKQQRVHYHIPIHKHHEISEGYGNEPYKYLAHADNEHQYNWGFSDNKKLVPPKPNIVRNTHYINLPNTEEEYFTSGSKKKWSSSQNVYRTRE